MNFFGSKSRDKVQSTTLFGNVRKINFPMLVRVLGWLLMIEGIFMFVPILTSLIYSESDVMAFIIAAGITLVTGAVMTFCIRPSHTQMAKREGFLLTALVWVVFSFFGMIPYIICEHQMLFLKPCRALLQQDVQFMSQSMCLAMALISGDV